MTETQFYLVVSVSVLVTLTLLLTGSISYFRTRRFLSTAIETTGEVLELVHKGSSTGAGTYSPRVRFKDISGIEFEFTEPFSSNPPEYKRGDIAAVYYDPGNPKKARSARKKNRLYYAAWLTLGLGTLFLIIQLIFAVLMLIISNTVGPLKLK